MDVVLIFLTITLIAILIVVYLLNRVPKITDLDKLFLNIQLMDPSVVAFTLNYDETTKKYTNVSRNDKLELVKRKEQYPISNLGSYVIPKDHGTIENLDNGFKLSGFDFTTFRCPAGYEGPTCKAKPLCVDGVDDGKLKPLTYTQFNDLHLSYNDSIAVSDTRRKRDASESTHPRIRIKCFTNGRYELQACPNNKLLNESLQCEPYDVCQDKISGSKHNFPISKDSAPLQENQYYICNNGSSEKASCGDGSIFSVASSTCIAKSACSGLGNVTLPRNDSSYIKCLNDVGTIVYCSNGIAIDSSGNRSCIISKCEPRFMTYSDDVITYTYGRIKCEDNKANTIKCDATTKTKSFAYEWAVPFAYTIDNWPREVLNLSTDLCEPATTDIINGPVNLAWSNAMNSAHKFDLVAEKYICDKETLFRWDYLHGVTVPQTDRFVDSSAPCQKSSSLSPPWREFETIVQYPKFVASKPFTRPKLLVGEPVNFPFLGWPAYVPKTKNYKVSLITVEQNKNMVISKYEMSIPPLGFAYNDKNSYSLLDKDAQLLDMFGFGLPENAENYNWFSIASGKFEQFQCAKAAVSETRYPIESLIPLSSVGEYAVMWLDLIDAKSLFATDVNNKKYYITRRGLESENGTMLQTAGYTILSVSLKDKDNVVAVTLSSTLSIKINIVAQPTITLNYV